MANKLLLLHCVLVKAVFVMFVFFASLFYAFSTILVNKYAYKHLSTCTYNKLVKYPFLLFTVARYGHAAGLFFTPRACRTRRGIAEFAGLENDGVEQEEACILNTMK